METADRLTEAAGRVQAALDCDEAATLAALTGLPTAAQRQQALHTARRLVSGARARRAERPYLDAFLEEFGLSNQEGIALLCLAEALLRVPDDDTADRLIADKLGGADWEAHAGRSSSLFVNASTWGLMLTGRLVELDPDIGSDAGWLSRLTRRVGEPVLRQAMRHAMRIIGDEFVVGRTIEAALARARDTPELRLCSFDMLGEGARTAADAERHLQSYRHAIAALAAESPRADDVHARASLSIKLSALHPRYTLTQVARVRSELVPRVLELVRGAASAGLAITIDAEESDRLELSMGVIEALARDPQTRDWPGLGIAVQAYGRRAPALIEWLIELAGTTRRQVSVRLVKGAYWDTEIKRAQERGLARYPVYTRKVNTDVAYLACAQRLLSVSDRVYSQFATHNTHTIGAVLAMRGSGVRCEFQRLHGMGQLLYDEARKLADFPPVRVYAPVGQHQDLLAYLVRRLLENGANTSFINRFMDERVPVEQVIADPLTQYQALDSVPHPDIPLPPALYGSLRRNSAGIDSGDSRALAALQRAVDASRQPASGGTLHEIRNPANHDERVGTVRFALLPEVGSAFKAAAAAQPEWNATTAGARAAVLERAADLIEAQRDPLLALLVREAGKTLLDAVAEIREAADFCRYYAAEARRLIDVPMTLPGPTGELNQLALQGRGVFVCISPWNFPLAIFCGQIAAALAAGNAVIAKPAEATPLTGVAMTALLHQAGVPPPVLHCLPMEGRPFGAAAMAHPLLAGVAFTGSTATGQWLNRALAARDGPIVPLIAETGGLNAMIVDSTALLEQVTDDVLASAFGSAGQRCSALRLLFLQDDIADRAIDMLAGAMRELTVGDPADPATDIGPVITSAAAAALQKHIDRMRSEARIVCAGALNERHRRGYFIAPHLIELGSAAQLRTEQFGPLLHVVRYRAARLDTVLENIRASGYALTLGVQSRIEARWRAIYRRTQAGNTYVNRNMVGAVVGVQPFGGTGLSGTGPKAGGPHYIAGFTHERTLTVNTVASGGNVMLLRLG